MAYTVVGTVKKYQQAIGLKKRNEYVKAWAVPCARDIATVFWSTWKDIESRIPTNESGEFAEAELQLTASEKRALKDKYTTVVDDAVKKHSEEMQYLIGYYQYKAYLAGYVEQARKMGVLSELVCQSKKEMKESGSVGVSELTENEIVWFGKSGKYLVGVMTTYDGKTKYVSAYYPTNKAKGENVDSINSYSATNGVTGYIGLLPQGTNQTFTDDCFSNEIKPTKQGGEKLPTAKTMLKTLNGEVKPKSTSAKSKKTVKKTQKEYIVSTSADVDGWVNVPNKRAVDYASKNAAKAVSGINDTTRNEIARIIQNGVDSGTSYGDIAKAIKSKFSEFAVPQPQKHIANRGVLVAVTELANAYCQANYEVGEELQKSGIKMMKAWQTLEDDRVSDGCRANQDSGWIEFETPFPSGDQTPPRFPGCRCDFLQDMLDESMLGRSIDDTYGKEDKDKESVSVAVAKKKEPSIGKPKILDKETLSSMEKVSGKPEYMDSILSYTGGFYDVLNEYLTTGDVSDSAINYHKYDWDFGDDKKEIIEYCKEWAANLNKLCLETKLPNGGSVFRLDDNGYDYEVGDVFSYDGYTSTSVSEDWLEMGDDDEFDPSDSKDSIRIDIPEGMNGVGAYFGKNSEYPEQREFLMNAGTKYEVVSKKPNDKGGYDWIWRVVG